MTVTKSGIILAAGLSSRMGSYKPFVKINGKCLIDWTVDSMISGGIKDLIIVTGYRACDIQKHLEERYGNSLNRFHFVKNENYRNGTMFDSMKCGFQEADRTDAVYLLPADMPAVSKETFFILERRMCNSCKKIFLPTVNGYRKHPPMISRECVKRILAYDGENGLRGFWKENEDQIEEVEVGDIGCTLDADYPEDINVLKTILGADWTGNKGK